MADFLSDMNALTQSVGNAANSITNLYRVRTDLESKRIATQVQKKNYDFIMRTKLKPGDPNRISFSEDGSGEYWREALDKHNQEVSSLVDTTRWEGVKGAVESYLQPMTQGFSLQIADSYAAQEVEKAQVDYAVAFGNELSMAQNEEQVEEVKSRYRGIQTSDEIYEPAKFEPMFNQMADAAQANVLFKRAVSSPAVAGEYTPDSSDPEGKVTAEKPANTASALAVIAASTATPAAKKQAAAAVESYAKQQTAEFEDIIKNNLTNRIPVQAVRRRGERHPGRSLFST